MAYSATGNLVFIILELFDSFSILKVRMIISIRYERS